jgi:gamma-glutamylcyclotransferase (GGCT)/AIG2-like uncharacterized protein YtfP
MLYFAYGSNMIRRDMLMRCPGATVVGVGLLRGYRVTERKWADIDRDPSAAVHGLVWKVPKGELRFLDEYEDYPNLYTRYELDIEMQSASRARCIVYEMTDDGKSEQHGKKYSKGYRRKCRQAAIENGIESAF